MSDFELSFSREVLLYFVKNFVLLTMTFYFLQNEVDPPRLHLSFEHVNRDGVYLLDTGSYVYIYISSNVESSIIKRLFDVNTFEKIDDEASLFSIMFNQHILFSTKKCNSNFHLLFFIISGFPHHFLKK